MEPNTYFTQHKIKHVKLHYYTLIIIFKF